MRRLAGRVLGLVAAAALVVGVASPVAAAPERERWDTVVFSKVPLFCSLPEHATYQST